MTASRKDRPGKQGGELVTYIRNNIPFTDTKIPSNLLSNQIELQITTIHINQHKSINLANTYIPPHYSTTSQQQEENDITNYLAYLTSTPDTLLLGYLNAHSNLWHSSITNHRGDLIEDILTNSQHIVLNQNTPTRIPPNKNQQPTSPDITTITPNLHAQPTGKPNKL